MSLVHVKRPDELVTCPYNPAHRVSSLKLPIHLLKCEKACLGGKLATCPFNASHRIEESNRAAHISTCPDKAYVERTLVAHTKMNVNTNLQVPSYESMIPEPTENWEAECNPLPVAGYDPTAHMNELTFRNSQTLSSMTRSQKKQYHNNLHANNHTSASSHTHTSVEEITPILKQLRLPKEEGITEKAQQPSNRSLGLGRGQSRLAANIFCTNLETNSLSGNSVSDFMAIARGRGLGQMSVSSSSSLPKVGQKKENVAPKDLAKDFEDDVVEHSKIEAAPGRSQTVRELHAVN